MSGNLVIKWQSYYRRPGVWLRVDPEILNETAGIGDKLDNALDEVSDWCRQNKCGRRMSYDMWKFKNESEMTMFLLRWS